MNSTKIFKEENIPNSLQSLLEDRERILFNSLYEASITLIPKSDKDVTRKLEINIVMNINAKILNKILVSRIQQCTERIIYIL